MVFPEAAAQASAHRACTNRHWPLSKIKKQTSKVPLNDFSDALVYTLAGQTIPAQVEVDSAVKAVLAAPFFDLPWFDALCVEVRFVQIMSEGGNSARCS